MRFNGGIFLFFFLVLLKVFLIGVYWLSTAVHRASPPSWTSRPTLPSSQVQSLHVITEQRAELPVCCMFCNLLSSRSVVSDSLQSHGLQHARLPFLLYLSEFAQTQVHRGDDAVQPSPLLWPPSPPALNLCQNQGLVQ